MKELVKFTFDRVVPAENRTAIIGMELFSHISDNVAKPLVYLQFKIVDDVFCELEFSIDGEKNKYLFSLEAEIRTLLTLIENSLKEETNETRGQLLSSFSKGMGSSKSSLSCNSTLYAFLAHAEHGRIHLFCEEGDYCAIFQVSSIVCDLSIELNGNTLNLTDLALWINKIIQIKLPSELDKMLHQHTIELAFEQIISKNRYNCTTWTRAELERFKEMLCYLNHLDQYHSAA